MQLPTTRLLQDITFHQDIWVRTYRVDIFTSNYLALNLCMHLACRTTLPKVDRNCIRIYLLYQLGLQPLMPHTQNAVRYAMPGQGNMSLTPPPPYLYHHPAAGPSPYGSTGGLAQWQYNPGAAGASPAQTLQPGGSDRTTPNPAMLFPPEYHLTQLQPGMIIPSSLGPAGYSPNNTGQSTSNTAAPSPHPQQQPQ